MKIIGLTGGIGMGKSTAASMFRRAHIPVFDADRAVHRLQAKGGAAVAPIGRAFPGTVTGGVIDRAVLRDAVLGDPARLKQLEKIIHPLVRQAQTRFLQRARRAGAPIVVLDIPLLFETGEPSRVPFIVVVSAPAAVQLARVRRRRTLSAAQIRAILDRQMPDREKRRRANLVIQTGLSRRHAQSQIARLIARLRPARVQPELA
jgi:dephospho-CoA kinase